jgi:hypothetical protein
LGERTASNGARLTQCETGDRFHVTVVARATERTDAPPAFPVYARTTVSQELGVSNWTYVVSYSSSATGSGCLSQRRSWRQLRRISSAAALPKMYEGRALLIVGQSLSAADPNYNQILASQRLSQTYAQLGTTTPVLSSVIEELALAITPQDLRRSISVQAPRESTMVTVTASHTDPAVAAAIANAIGNELIASSPAVEGRQQDVGRVRRGTAYRDSAPDYRSAERSWTSCWHCPAEVPTRNARSS